MTELCERFGVSREAGYVWLRRYCERGLEGLLEWNRAPRRHPNQTAVEQAVVELCSPLLRLLRESLLFAFILVPGCVRWIQFLSDRWFSGSGVRVWNVLVGSEQHAFDSEAADLAPRRALNPDYLIGNLIGFPTIFPRKRGIKQRIDY